MRLQSRILITTITTGGLLGIVIALTLTQQAPRQILPPQPSILTATITTSNGSAPKLETTSSMSTLASPVEPMASVPTGSAETTGPLMSAQVTSLATSVDSISSSDLPSPSPRGDSTTALETALFETVAWTTPSDLKKADDDCTIGRPDACLSLGEYYLAQAPSPSAARRSQHYFERAFSILVFKCNHREPDACATIARMHEFGRGIPKNPKAASTLVSHCRDLCRYNPGKVCSIYR
jgi:hypothetical protein